MTEEQLNVLEDWIVALIREQDRASGIEETVRVRALRKDVLAAFKGSE